MKTVLVVDDDVSIVRFIALCLTVEGLEVKRAFSGAAGLALIEETCPPDLVLLDLAMPEIDGRAFFERARLGGYNGPIIFCSAYGARAANAELGGQGFIEKPFDVEDLVDTVLGQLDPDGGASD